MAITSKKQAEGQHEEVYELTGDGAATTHTIKSFGFRKILAAIGTTAVPVIDNLVSPPTVALTFPAAPANGAKLYLLVRGEH